MRITIVMCVLVLNLMSYAQTIKTEIQVIAATVYLRGAKVTGKCEIQLKQGKNSIKVMHLPNDIDNNTFKISFPENTTLLSVSPSTVSLDENIESSDNKDLYEKTKSLQKSIQKLKLQIEVIEDEKKLLDENKQVGNSEQGWTAAEVQRLATYYSTRKLELANKKFSLEEEISSLEEQLIKIKKELNKLETSINPNLQKTLLLEVYANKALNAELQISYIIQNSAGWTPTYDIKALSIQKPIQLIYKGTVYQRTGQNWNQVQLTLSTYKPSANQNRPILSPLYVKKVEEEMYSNDDKESAKVGLSSSMASLNTYQMRSEKPKAYMANYNKEPAHSEIPITEISSGQMNILYSLNGTQTILSQEEGQTVILDRKELPTEYKYHVVPSMNTDVFLLGFISDWQKLNLINGNANIYLEDNYMGKTYINTAYTKDEYPISLGVDERVVVKRNQLIEKETEIKTKIGGKKSITTTLTNGGKTIKTEDKRVEKNKKTIEESNVFEISIKNNTLQPIKIEVLDQIPISEHNQINVFTKEISGGDYDKETGSILWTRNIASGLKDTLRLEYTVSYPKEIELEYYNK